MSIYEYEYFTSTEVSSLTAWSELIGEEDKEEDEVQGKQTPHWAERVRSR